MRKLLLIVCVVLPILGFSQNIKNKNEGIEWGLSGGLYQPFLQGDNFLANDYSVFPGVQFTLKARYNNLPGIGGIFSGNITRINDSRFLADFFENSRFQETGLFIYHTIPISEKISVEPRIGYGNFVAVNIDNTQKFRLNYDRIFGQVNVSYFLMKSGDYGECNLIGGFAYGILNGHRININQDDRNYVQKSSVLAFNLGIELVFH